MSRASKITVTNVARTIVDCFKFRNKIGTDVAVDTLRDGWRKKRFKMEELWPYASIFRMSRVGVGTLVQARGSTRL